MPESLTNDNSSLTIKKSAARARKARGAFIFGRRLLNIVPTAGQTALCILLHFLELFIATTPWLCGVGERLTDFLRANMGVKFGFCGRVEGGLGPSDDPKSEPKTLARKAKYHI